MSAGGTVRTNDDRASCILDNGESYALDVTCKFARPGNLMLAAGRDCDYCRAMAMRTASSGETR
jgi:hypothetical protein